MPIARRRGRRVTHTATWTGIAVALAVHGAFFGTVHALGIGLIGASYAHAPKHVDEVAEVDLRASCKGDASLANVARFSLCFAPWESNTDGCLDAVTSSVWIDLSACDLRDEKALASVAMLEPRQSEQMKSIDPEPL